MDNEPNFFRIVQSNRAGLIGFADRVEPRM